MDLHDPTACFQTLADLIVRRRSIRTYTGDPVARELLERMVDLASHAPSNNNRQGWRFYLVSNPDLIATMVRHVEAALDKAERQPGVVQDVLRTYRGNFFHFRSAPSIIVCCFAKPSRFPSKVFATSEENRHLTGELMSLSMCIQNLLLLVEAAGLGAVVMTAPLVAAPALKETLAIPGKYAIGALVSVGHYERKPPSPPRKPLANILRVID